MTYAGEDEWIKLGLREFPQTSHLILVCSGKNSHSPVKKGNIGGERDYLKSAQKLLYEFKQYESKFPKNKRRRFHIVTPPDTRDHHELIRYFRGLISHISENGERISINTTSGLQVWKLALYQAALGQREHIEKFYLIIKKTAEMKNIRLYRELKDFEENVIQIVSEKPNVTIGKLQEIYYKKHGKGNLSFISRTVKELVSEDLIKMRIAGREVKLNLTGDGQSYLPSSKYDLEFSKLYNKPNKEVS